GTWTLGKAQVKVMFRDKIEVHAGLIGEFQRLQMVCIHVRVRTFRFVVLLHVVKDSELHLPYSLFVGEISFWISSNKELSYIFSNPGFLTSAIPSPRNSKIADRPLSETQGMRWAYSFTFSL